MRITFDSDCEDPEPGQVLVTRRGSTYTILTVRQVCSRVHSRRFVLEVERGEHGAGKRIAFRWYPRGKRQWPPEREVTVLRPKATAWPTRPIPEPRRTAP